MKNAKGIFFCVLLMITVIFISGCNSRLSPIPKGALIQTPDNGLDK